MYCLLYHKKYTSCIGLVEFPPLHAAICIGTAAPHSSLTTEVRIPYLFACMNAYICVKNYAGFVMSVVMYIHHLLLRTLLVNSDMRGVQGVSLPPVAYMGLLVWVRALFVLFAYALTSSCFTCISLWFRLYWHVSMPVLHFCFIYMSVFCTLLYALVLPILLLIFKYTCIWFISTSSFLYFWRSFHYFQSQADYSVGLFVR